MNKGNVYPMLTFLFTHPYFLKTSLYRMAKNLLSLLIKEISIFPSSRKYRFLYGTSKDEITDKRI